MKHLCCTTSCGNSVRISAKSFSSGLLIYVNDIQQLEVKSMFQQGVIKLFFIADQPVICVLPVIAAWNPLS